MANIRVLNAVCDDEMRNLIIHAAHVKNLKSSEIAEFCLVSKRTAMHSGAMTHYAILEGNGNAESFTHFLDDLAFQRDRQHLAANSIIILDNVGFHRSGFEYKYLPPYSPFFKEEARQRRTTWA
jgi:hypothetical protein